MRQQPLEKNSAPDVAEKLAWLRLARTENVGPVTFYRLIERYGTAAKAVVRFCRSWSARGGRKKPLVVPALTSVEQEYERLRKIGGEIITAHEYAYPLPLGAVEDAPPVLSILGDAALLKKASIGIVGARNASLNGRKIRGNSGARPRRCRGR